MIYYKTEEEIEYLRKCNQMVSATLAEIGKMLKPGVTTMDVDKTAEEYIRDNGGVPGFKGYEGFPGSVCVSLNEEVVHGIPSTERVIQDGDIVSIDCGVVIEGFNGDSAFTFPVGDVKQETLDLMQATREALYKGIEQAVAGKRLGDIGHAVQAHVQQYGYSVVREMVGHGVGRDLHEDPQVPNYGRRGRGAKLKESLVIAIEPMVNLGNRKIYQEKDGWTIVAADKRPSAHYEHSLVVRKGQAEILSSFDIIDQALANTNQ